MRQPIACIRVATLGILGAILGVAAIATHAQSVSGIDTAEWVVFRNDKMGFEVKYPKHWHVQIPTGMGPENVQMSEPLEAGKESLSLQFWIQRKINSNGLPIDQWYDNQSRGLPPSSPYSRTTLGSRPAIRREVTGSLGRHFDVFASMNEADVFEVTIMQPEHQTRLNPIYDAILSTVKFLN